jgi:phosphotransacetylase
MSCLGIPTEEDIDRIAKAFVLDLSLFTVTDDESDQTIIRQMWRTYLKITGTESNLS